MNNGLLHLNARVMCSYKTPDFFQEHLLSIQDFFLESLLIEVLRIATYNWVKDYDLSALCYYQVQFPERLLTFEPWLFKSDLFFSIHARLQHADYLIVSFDLQSMSCLTHLEDMVGVGHLSIKCHGMSYCHPPSSP